MDLSLAPVMDQLPCRSTDLSLIDALSPHRSLGPQLHASKAGENSEGMKGTLQWLFQDNASTGGSSSTASVPGDQEDPTSGESTIDFINSLPLAAMSPGKAAAPVARPPHLPGDLVAVAEARPKDVFEALRSFFHEGVPSAVEEDAEAMTISATAFLDFTPTHVKAFVHANKGADSSATLVFRHTSQRDLVRFHRLFSSAVQHLQASGRLGALELQGGGCVPRCGGCGGGLIDDFLEDDEFEQDLDECAKSALDAAASLDAYVREEGLQALASLAEGRPDARPAIAGAISARPELTKALLQAPVAELYPFAAVLKLVTVEGSAALEGIAGLIEPLLSSGLPAFVAKELEGAYKNLVH